MHMSAEQRVAAPRERVWNALNDLEILRRSIPGCESLDRLTENELAAAVSVTVGAVKARFTGKITLSDIDRPNRYRISGEGSSGAAGFAKGGATVTLHPDGDGTLLHYEVEATAGGKLAEIGPRLVDAAARKMADDFFLKFNELVSVVPAAKTDADADADVDAAPAHVPALRPSVWVPLLIAIVGVLLLVFARS
jgi:uncharacterized protein